MLVFLKIIVHDGNTGETVGSLGGEKAHNGGIYAVSRNSLLKHRHLWLNGIIHFQTLFFLLLLFVSLLSSAWAHLNINPNAPGQLERRQLPTDLRLR